MKTEGQKLKETIEKSGKSVVKVAQESKVSRSHIYTLYQQETIEDEFIDRLSRAGIFIRGTGNNDSKTEIDSADLKIMQMTIDHLKEKLEIAEGEILYLRSLLTPELLAKATQKVKQR